MHEIWEALVEGAPFSFINLGVLAFGVGVIIDRAWYIRMNYSVDARGIHEPHSEAGSGGQH